jgi:hypothetical protein
MRDAILLRLLPVVIACTLTGCASDHDLKRNGYNLAGGGFIDDEIRPGLYSIKGYSNFAILPSLEQDGAAKTFFKRADALCGAGAYTVLNHNLGTYSASVHVTFMAGHVLCANSGITVEEARKILSPD